MFVSRLFFLLATALYVRARIYVTQPATAASCHGGQPCTVQWLDDGQAPLLSSIGDCKVGLYTGDLELLQTIDPVNVDSAHSLTFTPNSQAGPNSGLYYIAFIPTSDTGYRGYSPWFTLDNMSGSFSSSSGGNSTSTGSAGSGTTYTSPSTSATGSSTGTYTESTTASTGTNTGTSSGFSTSHTSTSLSSTRTTGTSTSSSTSTPTKSNAAVPNSIPAAGFAWSLMALFGTTLL